MEFNNIRLLVKDFDACFKFYAEDLGLNVTWGQPGGEYASFDIGLPSGLAIFKSDLMAHALGNFEKELPADHREKMVIVIKVDSVDDTYKKLKDKKIQFFTEPKDMSGWGMRTAHFRDPEGNVIEIFSELLMSQWDDDLREEAKEN